MPTKTKQADTLVLADVQVAFDEIDELYQRAQSGGKLEGWKVSAQTNAIVQFSSAYQARLTATQTLNRGQASGQVQLRADLLRQLRTWLHTLQAVLDYGEAAKLSELSSAQVPAAVERYNIRAHALELFLDQLQFAPLPAELSSAPADLVPALVKKCKGKSERELFQVVSRTVPVDEPLEDELTALLASLIRSAHTEPAIQPLVTDANLLIANERDMRALATSQELRDYVAPYLAVLVKKALMSNSNDEPVVDAFDDAFRNTYFAVVNRVIHYYREHPGAERIAKVPAQQSSKSSVGQAEKFDQRDPRSGASVGGGLPVKDDGKVGQVGSAATPTVPLITEDQIETAELLDDGQTVDIDTTAKRGKGSVLGTGLS